MDKVHEDFIIHFWNKEYYGDEEKNYFIYMTAKDDSFA